MYNPIARKLTSHSRHFYLFAALCLFACPTAVQAGSAGPEIDLSGANFARLHGSTRSNYDKLRAASERIEALRSEVAAVQQLKASISARYKGLALSALSPQDAQAMADLQQRERTLKERHNVLASQYNQWMVETNYRFNSPLGLPQGIKQILPRHYIPLTDVVIF